MEKRIMKNEEAKVKIAMACALIMDVRDHYKDPIDNLIESSVKNHIHGATGYLIMLEESCENMLALLKDKNVIERLKTSLSVAERVRQVGECLRDGRPIPGREVENRR